MLTSMRDNKSQHTLQGRYFPRRTRSPCTFLHYVGVRAKVFWTFVHMQVEGKDTSETDTYTLGPKKSHNSKISKEIISTIKI